VSAFIVSSASTTFFGAGQPLSERHCAERSVPCSIQWMRAAQSGVVIAAPDQ